mgnify:CR=1 FL=1
MDSATTTEHLIKQSVTASTEAEIEWYYENDRELVALIYLTKHLNSHGINKVKLFMPYIPNARQDRVKSDEDVFTLKTFANLINILQFDKVYIWDAHSNVGIALIDRCENVSPIEHIKDALLTLGYNSNSVCLFFPDEGAMKRYGTMFPEIPQAFGIKKRNWETQKIESYMIVGEENIKNHKVLIIDDICSYGNTFVKAAEALHEAGAAGINLYVTHCEDAIAKGNVFTCGLIDHVFTTDSLVRSAETDAKLYHV